MSMPNLLPWRRQQRNQRLRFWGLLFTASLLVMLAGGVSLRATQTLASQALQSDLAGTRAVQKVLKARQPQSAGLEPPSQPPETVAWQPALESLASAMPRQAWLTALRYQPPSLWPKAGRRPVVTQVKPVQPFSPLAFQREDARLVYWKPQQSGGELALDALWGAVPALFSRLALENVRVSAFSITPQGKQLRLSLQLEIGHAQ